ncbi:uncharacterized protein BDV14DRAFT_31949 [Aspergillus stella-maris]|uniref:uncharacterized protein n=1 Tax=Aspergillus stella-maris TaxID=1810926 RepID=UPI003CCDDBD0
MAPKSIQFIVSSASSTNTSGPAESRKARSHAARSAHAKVRRQRIIEYQSKKAREGRKELELSKYITSSRPIGGDPIHPLSYHRRDPFMSCARRLEPNEEVLFDHYVISVVPLMRCNSFDADFFRRMMQAWIPFAFATESMLDVMLLVACRHLVESYKRQQLHESYLESAYRYKAGITQSLREAISVETPHFTDTTILKAVMMAYDELWTHDNASLEFHINAASEMVTWRGGPQSLGLDGFIERLLFNLIMKINRDISITVKSPYDPRICSVELLDEFRR